MCSCHVGVLTELRSRQGRRLSHLCPSLYRQRTFRLPPTGRTTSGAERAYKKIVDKLTGLLVDAGVLGVVELKLTDKNKKIAAAAYQYKAIHRYANDDDEWGAIRFDFSAGTAQIVKLADNGNGENTIRELIAAAGFYIPLAPPLALPPYTRTVGFCSRQIPYKYNSNKQVLL